MKWWAVILSLMSSLAACSQCGDRSPSTSKPTTSAPTIDAAPAASSSPASASASTAPRRPKGFLKGQLHAHTNGSGDSNTPAEEVHRFYEERGYDFVVFTDHNVITDTDDSKTMLTFPGVELTRNLSRCEPPPNDNSCSLHTNALFVTDKTRGPIDLGYPKSLARRDTYISELKRAKGPMTPITTPTPRSFVHVVNVPSMAITALSSFAPKERSPAFATQSPKATSIRRPASFSKPTQRPPTP